MKKKKQPEVVAAPAKPSKKAVELIIENTVEKERFGVLTISRNVAKYFSSLMFIAGILLFSFSVISLKNFINLNSFFPGNNAFSFFLWIFVSIANIIAGLLMMGSG